jgi:hypothetical protein
MNGVWQTMLPFIKQGDWGGYSRRKPDDPLYAELSNNWYTHADLWTKPTIVMDCGFLRDDGIHANYALRLSRMLPLLPAVSTALRTLAQQPEALIEPFILRDAIDLVRTALGRAMSFTLMRAWSIAGDTVRVAELEAVYLRLLSVMTPLLSLHADYSLYQTLQSLREAAPTNPDFEITLKRNFLNQYCVQAAYEPAATVFEPEARAVFGWMKQPDADLNTPPSFAAVREEVYGRFMDTPLSAMQPETIPAPQAVILQAADAVDAFASAAGR